MTPAELQAQVQEYVKASLVTAWVSANPNALTRRIADDPRSIAATVLMWSADPSNEVMKRLGDATIDRKGQSAAWLAQAAALRDEVRFDLRTGKRVLVTGLIGGADRNPAFSLPVPGFEGTETWEREAWPDSYVDRERVE